MLCRAVALTAQVVTEPMIVPSNQQCTRRWEMRAGTQDTFRAPGRFLTNLNKLHISLS